MWSISYSAFLASSLNGSQENALQAEQFLTPQIAENDKSLAASPRHGWPTSSVTTLAWCRATGRDYFTRLRTETDSARQGQDRSSTVSREQKHDELQRQLASDQPLVGGWRWRVGSDTATQIRETQARLDELLLRFTDKHPDVIAARSALDDLKRARRPRLRPSGAVTQAAIAASGLAANPVYQNIRMQLSQADVEVAAARRQVTDQQAQIDELHKMINVAPGASRRNSHA